MPVVENKVVPMDRSSEGLDASDDKNAEKINSKKAEDVEATGSGSSKLNQNVSLNFQFNIMEEISGLYERCTYDNAKLAIIWFLDTANIKFSISVCLFFVMILLH